MEKPINDLIQLGAALAKMDEARATIEKLNQEGALTRIRAYADTLPSPANSYWDELKEDLNHTHRWFSAINLICQLVDGKVTWR